MIAQPANIEPKAYATFPLDDSIISWLKRNSCASNYEVNFISYSITYLVKKKNTNLHQPSVQQNARTQRVKDAADYRSRWASGVIWTLYPKSYGNPNGSCDPVQDGAKEWDPVKSRRELQIS